MTAKQARKLTKAARPIESPEPECKTPAQKLQDQIDCWEYFIKEAAISGHNRVVLSYPVDELFPILYLHFSKQGFRVSEYTTDEGYCIGDQYHVEISWS